VNSGTMTPNWSLARQLNEWTRALLHLKAWRLVFLIPSAVLLFSGAYLSIILSRFDLDADSELRFYRTVDIGTAWKLQVGKQASESDTLQLETVSGIRWDSQLDLFCTVPARTCIEQLLTRANNNKGKLLLQTVAKAKSSPIMLECLAENSSSFDCSLLYQPKKAKPSQLSALKEINLLYFETYANGSVNSTYRNPQVPVATDTVPARPQAKEQKLCNSSNKLFRTVVAVSFSISTMAVILYFSLSTAYCIHRLKMHNFLKLQHLSGLCATAFWLPTFVITIVECLVLSGVFVAGQVIQCPELRLASHRAFRVLIVYFLHSISLAMLAILCATVLTYAAACTLMMLLNMALIGSFAYAPGLLESGATAVLYLYPPISSLQVVESHVASDGIELLTHQAAAHHRSIFPCMFATPIIIAIAILYLDFILPDGNGLCLPVYFPITKRFWMPDKLEQTDTTNLIDVKIYPGHITWLLGNSGSGKSTLLRLLSGFHQRAAAPSVVCGSVTMLNGFQATEPLDRLLVRRKVAANLSQNANDGICTCLTVRRGLSLTLASRGCVIGSDTTATPRELLTRLGLAGVEDQTPADLNLCQRKLLSLANCLAGCAQLVLLDEPTKGLEAAAKQRVWRLLRDICRQTASVSIVVASSQNDMPTIAPDERIVYLSGGQVAGVGTKNFLAQAFNCRRYCVSATLLQPVENSAAAVQNLLNRLPNGVVERSSGQRGSKLSLLVEPELLLGCVRTLESAVGQVITHGGIQLGPMQPLRLPKRWLARDNVSRLNFNELNESDILVADSNSTDNGNNNNKSSSSASESGKTPLQPKRNHRDNEKVKINRERLHVSPFTRICTLGSVHAKRLVRSRCDFVTRLVVPILLLISLLLATAYERALYRTSAPDYLIKSRKVPTTVNLSAKMSNPMEEALVPNICVVDELEGEQEAALKYQDCSGSNSIVLRKSGQLNLLEFLLVQSPNFKLNDSCLQSCLVIYCQPWNRVSSDNGNRTVTIAVLDGLLAADSAPAKSSHVHLYRTAVAKVFKHFDAQLDLSDLKLAQQTQYLPGGFLAKCSGLIFLLTAFSVFPASFFNQVADDMDSNVYRYLTSLGMSRLGYWLCTFVIHWLQYGVYFLLLTLAQNTWDRFRNQYYLSCIFVPVLIFGTSSNLLSVYTTVALTVCDVHRCLGQHLDCVGKGLFGRKRETNREMQPMSSRLGPAASSSHHCILDVRSLWKTCPVSGFPLVKGIGFRLAEGQSFSLVGPGGSGKSITAAIAAGEVMPTSGECRVFCDGSLCKFGAQPWRHRPSCGAIGYCPQYSPLFKWLTVQEHLFFYAQLRGLKSCIAGKRIRELLLNLGLIEYQQLRIGGLDRRTRSLVCLAASLLSKPLLLVIDNDFLGNARAYLRKHAVKSVSNYSDTRTSLTIVATAESVKQTFTHFSSSDGDSNEFQTNDSDGEEEKDDAASGEVGSVRGSNDGEISKPASEVFGVLHRGRIVAMGTRSQLRSIYGNWFVLDITLDTNPSSVGFRIEELYLKVTSAILTHFKGALLLEETHCWLQFCLPSGSVGRLSNALSWLANSLTVEQAVLYTMPLDQAMALQQLSIIKQHVQDEDIATRSAHQS
uniref:ABC transporter domain-containing protein n=1 Tax=Macrostomum lignano TaxID=282301 RepID=A0A1I8HHY2_9PLAT